MSIKRYDYGYQDGYSADGMTGLQFSDSGALVKYEDHLAELSKIQSQLSALTTSERSELENYRNAQQVVPEWTNEQCLEFLSIAFRHAEIKGDLEMDDIRLGVKMANSCSAAMLQGKDEHVQGWIPCSERMPEIEGHYLVWANASNLDGYCDHQAMATYQGGEWNNEFNWLVTHWMPLPAAPQHEVNK